MPRILTLIALLLVMTAVPTEARTTVDLNHFRGLYTGIVNIMVAGGTYRGEARIRVRVPKHGHSAIMSVSGKFEASGKVFAISNHFSFDSDRHATERSVTNGFSGGQVQASGKYITHRQKLIFRLPFQGGTSSGVSVGQVVIRPGDHGKQILALTTSVSLNGGIPDYLYNFQVSKYLVP